MGGRRRGWRRRWRRWRNVPERAGALPLVCAFAVSICGEELGRRSADGLARAPTVAKARVLRPRAAERLEAVTQVRRAWRARWWCRRRAIRRFSWWWWRVRWDGRPGWGRWRVRPRVAALPQPVVGALARVWFRSTHCQTSQLVAVAIVRRVAAAIGRRRPRAAHGEARRAMTRMRGRARRRRRRCGRRAKGAARAIGLGARPVIAPRGA